MSDPYKVDRWICATCGHDSSLEPHWKVRAEHAEARVKELNTTIAELRKLCGEAADAARCSGTCGGCSRCRLAGRLRAAEKGETNT